MTKEITISPQAYIRSGKAQEIIEQTLGDGAKDFTLAIISTINSNPVLQGASPQSIIKSGFEAAALGLPISNSLGFAYIIPYNNKKKDADGKDYWVTEAQFQLGYKGFKQLAIRTGEYRTINVTDVREGEFKGENYLTGELEFEWTKEGRESLKVTGYVAYFQLNNGYSKTLMMTVEELLAHAKRYSKNFAKYGSGKWKDDFDMMARKTVIKLLLSRDGLITGTLKRAIEADQASLGEDDTYKYIDNEKEATTEKHEEVVEGEVTDEQ